MIRDLINAIAEGNTLAIDNSFNAVMANKIAERLDDMRVSVAQNMFGSVVEESVELDEKVWDADGRTTTQLKKQVRGLSDDQLKDWSKNPKSIFDTKTKKVQDRIISHEVKNRGKVKEEVELDEERGDMGTDNSPKGSCRGSSMPSMDIAKMSGYTHAVMHMGAKGKIDSYHTTKASADKKLASLRKKHNIPENSPRARIAEL